MVNNMHELVRTFGDARKLIDQVIQSSEVYSAEVENKDGEAILMKILPYVSGTDRIGAILNLVNLNRIRHG